MLPQEQFCRNITIQYNVCYKLEYVHITATMVFVTSTDSSPCIYKSQPKNIELKTHKHRRNLHFPISDGLYIPSFSGCSSKYLVALSLIQRTIYDTTSDVMNLSKHSSTHIFTEMNVWVYPGIFTFQSKQRTRPTITKNVWHSLPPT